MTSQSGIHPLVAPILFNFELSLPLTVGSHQVPFPMCTLETLQKYCSTGSLLLTFC